MYIKMYNNMKQDKIRYVRHTYAMLCLRFAINETEQQQQKIDIDQRPNRQTRPDQSANQPNSYCSFVSLAPIVIVFDGSIDQIWHEA